CTRLATTAKIHLEIDPSALPAGVPMAAFKRSVADVYDIGRTEAGQRTPKLDDVKAALPVRLAPEKAAEYDRKFGRATGNREPWVRIFADGAPCSRSGPHKSLRFDGEGEPSAATWPVKGQVFHSSDGQPASLCADATLEKDGQGRPYLTFALQGARAPGKRTVVVISMSKDFQQIAEQPLRDALIDLIEATVQANRTEQLLPPITIYSVDAKGEYHLVFKGEDIVLNPQEAAANILNKLQTGALVTPDFKVIPSQSGLSHPSGDKLYDRLVFIMDGAEISRENSSVLAGEYLDLMVQENPSNIAMLLSSGRCEQWKRRGNRPLDFTCIDLRNLRTPSEKRERIAETLKSLLRTADNKK
ncbi:MAG: hypothetical protein ACREC6_11810, partial [Hyphomicrobiaceae bacterium]